MLKIQNVSDIWILVIEIYLGFVILNFGFTNVCLKTILPKYHRIRAK